MPIAEIVTILLAAICTRAFARAWVGGYLCGYVCVLKNLPYYPILLIDHRNVHCLLDVEGIQRYVNNACFPG